MKKMHFKKNNSLLKQWYKILFKVKIYNLTLLQSAVKSSVLGNIHESVLFLRLLFH